jgi:hypothetical protein
MLPISGRSVPKWTGGPPAFSVLGRGAAHSGGSRLSQCRPRRHLTSDLAASPMPSLTGRGALGLHACWAGGHAARRGDGVAARGERAAAQADATHRCTHALLRVPVLFWPFMIISHIVGVQPHLLKTQIRDKPQCARNGDKRPNRENAIQFAMFEAFQAQPKPNQHNNGS